MKRALKQEFKPKDDVHSEFHTTTVKVNKNERMKFYLIIHSQLSSSIFRSKETLRLSINLVGVLRFFNST